MADEDMSAHPVLVPPVASAPERGQHLGERDELLARAALAGARRLGRLDLLPVAEGDDLDAALAEQAVEPGTSRLAAVALAERPGDLLGDLIAVRAIGADRPGRAAPRPADAVEPAADHAFAIGEAAAIRLIGHAFERRRPVADAGDDEAAGDRVGLAG